MVSLEDTVLAKKKVTKKAGFYGNVFASAGGKGK